MDPILHIFPQRWAFLPHFIPLSLCMFKFMLYFLYRSLSFNFLTANFRLGVFGNSIVIISVFRHKSLQSVRNLFIVALSTSDIVAIVFSGTITVCRLYLSLISFSSHALLLANHGIFKGLALRHWSLQARSCNSGKMDHKMR